MEQNFKNTREQILNDVPKHVKYICNNDLEYL